MSQDTTGYDEACCWNDVRDSCPLPRGGACVCACHVESVEVTIHGAYGQGQMPPEFARAISELVRLVVEAVDRGELGGRCGLPRA
jgi:hypothetical protein